MIEIDQPNVSLPGELAGFSGKWEGIWGGQIGRFVGKGIDTTIVVEKTDTSQASVILSFGSNDDLGAAQGFNRFTVPVTLKGSPTLIWDWDKWGVSFQYTLSSEQTNLIGNSKVLGTGETFATKLKKVEIGQVQIVTSKPVVPYQYMQSLVPGNG